MAVELKDGKVDIEALKQKENLTVDESDAISEAARKEALAEDAKENETPEQKTEREETEKVEAETKTREELDNRAKEAGLEPGVSEEEVKAKEVELGKHKETEEEQQARETEEAEAKVKLDEDVKALAVESKISEDDARKELEHVQKVGEKYGHDSKKLAKAFLSQQRENIKLQEDLKERSKPAPISIAQVPIEKMVELIEKGQLTSNGNAISKEHVIQSYKQNYAELTKDMEDEKIIQLAAKDLQGKFVEQDKDNLSKLGDAAKIRRTELLNTLSEDEKEYLPAVQSCLEKTPDVQVVQEGYSLDDYVRWARGDKNHFDTKLKSEYDRGLKQGKEQAKILGEKPPIGGGKPPVKTDTNAAKVSKLTEAQKTRALEMYDTDTMTQDEKFLAYIDYLEDDKTKKK